MMKPCFILQLKIDRDLAILRTGKFPFPEESLWWDGTSAFGEIKPHSGSLTDFAILRLMRDLELRGAEIVELCLEDIDWRAGTLVVRDERLGANIKLQLDIVSFFDIDFERPAEVLADQCAGCASRLDRGVEILIHN